jgi:hypothetical protein
MNLMSVMRLTSGRSGLRRGSQKPGMGNGAIDGPGACAKAGKDAIAKTRPATAANATIPRANGKFLA